MAAPLQFLFQLLDKMSQPADQITKSLNAANKAMAAAKGTSSATDAAMLKVAVAEAKVATETRRLAKELDGYTKQLAPVKKLTMEWGNMFHSFAGFRKSTDGGWVFNVADGLRSVLDVVERLGGAMYDVTAKALQVGAASEKSGRAIKLNLGTKAGEEATEYIRRVSDRSRGQYTQTQLRELLMPAIQEKYKTKDLEKLLAVGMDVRARGLDEGGAISALTNVRTNRQFGADTLNALGFGGADEKARIAKRLGGVGVSPNAALGTVGQFTEVSKGKAQRVYDILLDELQRRAGGKLGIEGQGAQTGPDATMARLANIGDIWAEKLSANGGLKSLYEALDKFATALTSPQVINGLQRVLGAFVDTIDWIRSKIEDQGAIDRASGIEGRAQTGPNAGLIYDAIDVQQAALRLMKQNPSLAGVPVGASPGLYQLEQERKARNAGAGGASVLKLPTGSDAEQFGYALEVGRQQAAIAAASAPKLPTDGSADDFIWRNGRAIEINPQDSIIGFKRGGSLGAGEGGGGSSGAPSFEFTFGDIYLDGKRGGKEQAAEFVDEVRDMLPGAMLSLLEQFAADAGA